MSTPVRVLALVDWDTARRVAVPDIRLGRSALAGRSIRALQDHLARVLADELGPGPLRVTLRLYHGWYRGKSKTLDRLDLEDSVRREPIQRVLGAVSFAPELDYCDRLMCGGPRDRLFDTVRRRTDGKNEQKMVDTALVSDLLQFARSRRGETALVVGDDDDLLPGVITAEMWGSRVLVARVRESDNSNLSTAGLICRMRMSP